jgi:AcrR family transcriptional regulator
MGNREDLLAGAKRCLLEKGYARTTARDIAGASGVSLAGIGYHFGSKEALLFEAFEGLLEEFAAEVGGAAAGLDFAAAWDRVIELFPKYGKAWLASIEMLAQLDEPMRQRIAAWLDEGRAGLTALFGEGGSAHLGSVYQALMSGMLVQWIVDPQRAPAGRDLAEALRELPINQAGRPRARRSSPAG